MKCVLAASKSQIDQTLLVAENVDMNAVQAQTLVADAHAVIVSLVSGRALDPDVARRVTDRSKALRVETTRKYGVREIAVELIRKGRH